MNEQIATAMRQAVEQHVGALTLQLIESKTLLQAKEQEAAALKAALKDTDETRNEK